MSIPAKIVIAILVFLAGSAFGIKFEKGQQAIRDNERMEQARADHARQEKSIDTAAQKHEADKTRIETKFVVITEKESHVLQSDFYAPGQPACLDDDGLHLLTEGAKPAADAASQPQSAMPGLKPSRWWQPKGSPRLGSEDGKAVSGVPE
jgi:hypothetical protein